MKNIEGKDERLQADIHQLDHKHEEGIHVNKQIHSEYRKTQSREDLDKLKEDKAYDTEIKKKAFSLF